jgi:uncharacterized membrane protein
VTRSTLVAATVAVVVAVVMQATLLVFAQLSVATASVLAGLVLGYLQRPDAVRELALPAAVIGVASTLGALAVMAGRGSPVLEVRYLVSWVVTALLGAVLAGMVAWGSGRLSANAR